MRETLKVLPELVEITASTQDEAFIAAVDAVQPWLTLGPGGIVQSGARAGV